MDKNTIIGLVLIGVLLVGFSILSRPSQEQLEGSPATLLRLHRPGAAT